VQCSGCHQQHKGDAGCCQERALVYPTHHWSIAFPENTAAMAS